MKIIRENAVLLHDNTSLDPKGCVSLFLDNANRDSRQKLNNMSNEENQRQPEKVRNPATGVSLGVDGNQPQRG